MGRIGKWTLALAALAAAGRAGAVDMTGYFRSSIGGNSRGGGQACYQTPGMAYKLRLGNECETYGEWGFSQSVYKDKAGVEWKVGFMLDYVTKSSATGEPLEKFSTGGDNFIGLQQNWASVTIPQWGGMQFWAGQEYYRRENIDMIDFFYLNTSEPGAGVQDVDLHKLGKLSFSVFQTKGTVSTAGPTEGSADFRRAFWRPDLRVYGIPVNPNGTLEVDLNVVMNSRNQGAPKLPNEASVGPWITVEHTQTNLTPGGYNKLAVQWASGPATQMGPGAPASLDKGDRQLRVLDQLLLQPSLKLQTLVGGTFAAIKVAGARQTQWGLFGRPVYYLSDLFKLQGDLGFTQVKPKGESARNLFKLTFAPTITPAPGADGGFFVRPEIRAFVTYASWNRTAADATPPPGQGLLGTELHGFSFGTSVEAWF
jgi:maltoporin